MLDEKLEHEALTGILDMDNKYVGEVNDAGQVEIPQFSVMDGLFDYSTSDGFTAGDLSLTYQTVTLDWDRGIEFNLDAKLDEEAGMVASAGLMNEFYRSKLVPEVDAVRFAAYAQAADAASHAAVGTLDSTTVIAALEAGEASIGQVVDPTEAILFVSWSTYGLMKAASAFRFTKGDGGSVDRNIEYWDGIRVVKVPDARFYPSVTKNTVNGGVTGSGAINFLFVVPRAVQQVKKFEKLKIFTPDENQSKDAWKYQVRLHHGMWVLDQKAQGLYVHTKATVKAMSVDPTTASIAIGATEDVTIKDANGAVTAAITGTDKDYVTATIAGDKCTIGVITGATATHTATVTLTDSIGDTATVTVTVAS